MQFEMTPDELPCPPQLIGYLLHQLTCEDCGAPSPPVWRLSIQGERDGEQVVLVAFAAIVPTDAAGVMDVRALDAMLAGMTGRAH